VPSQHQIVCSEDLAPTLSSRSLFYSKRDRFARNFSYAGLAPPIQYRYYRARSLDGGWRMHVEANVSPGLWLSGREKCASLSGHILYDFGRYSIRRPGHSQRAEHSSPRNQNRGTTVRCQWRRVRRRNESKRAWCYHGYRAISCTQKVDQIAVRPVRKPLEDLPTGV
jgi:hypothetical protein